MSSFSKRKDETLPLKAEVIEKTEKQQEVVTPPMFVNESLFNKWTATLEDAMDGDDIYTYPLGLVVFTSKIMREQSGYKLPNRVSRNTLKLIKGYGEELEKKGLHDLEELFSGNSQIVSLGDVSYLFHGTGEWFHEVIEYLPDINFPGVEKSVAVLEEAGVDSPGFILSIFLRKQKKIIFA